MNFNEVVRQTHREIKSDDITTLMKAKQSFQPVSVSENDMLSEINLISAGSAVIKDGEMTLSQKEDEIIKPVYDAVLKGRRPKKLKGLRRKSRILLNQFRKLEIVNNILVRKTSTHNQVVLPHKYKKTIYQELHENLAHLGTDRVVDLTRQRFYWPCMTKDITHYVRHQCKCLKDKPPNQPERAPLVPIKSTAPFEIVSIDYMKLDKCKGGYEYVLMVCDHFTRYVQAYATKQKSGKSAAEKIFNDYILKYGFLERLHHDQGGEFNNDLFNRLHELSGIRKSKTTPYYPMGDGQVERMNRTF